MVPIRQREKKPFYQPLFVAWSTYKSRVYSQNEKLDSCHALALQPQTVCVCVFILYSRVYYIIIIHFIAKLRFSLWLHSIRCCTLKLFCKQCRFHLMLAYAIFRTKTVLCFCSAHNIYCHLHWKCLCVQEHTLNLH